MMSPLHSTLRGNAIYRTISSNPEPIKFIHLVHMLKKYGDEARYTESAPVAAPSSKIGLCMYLSGIAKNYRLFENAIRSSAKK